MSLPEPPVPGRIVFPPAPIEAAPDPGIGFDPDLDPEEASRALFEELGLLDRIAGEVGVHPTSVDFDWDAARDPIRKLGVDEEAADRLRERLREEADNRRQVEIWSEIVLYSDAFVSPPVDPVTGDTLWPILDPGDGG